MPNNTGNIFTDRDTPGSFENISIVSSATYTLLETDEIVHITRTLTGACTITIPSAQIVDDRIFTIVDGGNLAGTNNITIETEGAELINFKTSESIVNNGNSKSFYCYDGDIYIR